MNVTMGVQPLRDLVLTDEIFLILPHQPDFLQVARENVVMRYIFPAFFIKFNDL